MKKQSYVDPSRTFVWAVHEWTAQHAGQLNILAQSWGAGLRGEDLKHLVLGLKDTSYLVIYISWMEVKISNISIYFLADGHLTISIAMPITVKIAQVTIYVLFPCLRDMAEHM